MARTRMLILVAGVVALAVVGVAVWASAQCCGLPAAAPARKPAEAQVTSTTPFQVLDVTGPAKGQEVCYICRYGGRPSLAVFTRTMEGHFPEIARAVEQFVAENRKQRAAGFVVLLGENTKTNREALVKVADDHKLSIPLTIALDGPKGPKSYNLNGEFDTLVLVGHRNKVHSSFALRCIANKCEGKPCARTDEIVAAAERMLDEI